MKTLKKTFLLIGIIILTSCTNYDKKECVSSRGGEMGRGSYCITPSHQGKHSGWAGVSQEHFKKMKALKEGK
jgi:hypothetical protein